MTTTTITLSDVERRALDALAERTGKTHEALIHDGLARLIESEQAPIAGAQPDDWREAIKQAAGIWKDRDDLPDFEALRRQSDDRLRRFGIGEPDHDA